jgi:hypothetical protein
MSCHGSKYLKKSYDKKKDEKFRIPLYPIIPSTIILSNLYLLVNYMFFEWLIWAYNFLLCSFRRLTLFLF